jgi:biotin carboxyl carrier protein
LKLQIKIDGKIYAAEVEVLDEDENEQLPSYVPQVSNHAAVPPTPGIYAPGHQVDGHSADKKLYCSPVTGLVVKVNVTPGQEINPHDVIMVLEAMKMETSVVAHHAGRVKSVKVSEGNPVKLHQVIVEVE